MRMTRRAVLRAGVSAAVTAALASCSTGPRSSAADKPDQSTNPAQVGPLPSAAQIAGRTSFGMVGDSITRASSKALTSLLTEMGFTDIHIDAEVSRRIDVGDGKAEPLAGVKVMHNLIAMGVNPDVWAVGLGTNDVGKYKDEAAYAAVIDEMLAIPDGDIPMLWVDVYNPLHLEDTKLFNTVLRDRAKARGNTSVLSWYDLASNPKSKILRSDHIHPNDDGALVFADLVARALG
jgi:lysophospholipase L1-like esterase